MDLLLELRDIDVVFTSRGRRVEAVKEFSWRMRCGDILSIVGESGSGKTTVGRVISLLQKPSKGTVLYKSTVDPWKLGKKDFMKIKVKLQYVYQDPYASLNPTRSIYEILAPVVKLYHKNLSNREVHQKVVELLELVGITPPEYFLNKYPHHLSGGMRQRLNIARALIPSPELIVADEPVSMIDPSLKVSVLDLLRELNHKMKLSIVYITHELGTIKYIGYNSPLLVMLKGYVVEAGIARDVFEKPFHPYSKALMAFSTSREDYKKVRELYMSKLLVEDQPNLKTPLKGCPFAGRCPWVKVDCQLRVPALRPYSGRLVRCHYIEEVSGV